MTAWQARIWIEKHEPKAIAKWMEERELVANGEIDHLLEMEYVVLARVLIAQGQLDEALMLGNNAAGPDKKVVPQYRSLSVQELDYLSDENFHEIG